MRVATARAAVAFVVAGGVVVQLTTEVGSPLATAVYMGVLIGTSVGAWIGVHRRPHGRRLVATLVAVGITLNTTGEAVWSALDVMGANTDVTAADPLWMASYVALCAALLVVLMQALGSRRVNADFVIDILTVVVVSLLVFWSVSIDAIVADHDTSSLVRVVLATYPVADAVLLALVARALMNPVARSAIGNSLAIGLCLWLLADIVYLRIPSGGTAEALTNCAWMVAPVLMSRVTWRSSRVPSTDRSASRTNPRWTGQLLIAVGPLLVPPALDLAHDLRGRPGEPMELLVGTAVLSTLAFVRTARLIGSERRAQRDFEMARDAAVEASRVKSMFLATMSHEIRTPLTTVLAAAELLEDTALDDLQITLLRKMSRSAEHLRQLVEDILDFSRIEAGRVSLTSDSFDLWSTLHDAAEVYAPRAAARGLGFEVHCDARVPHEVVGDQMRLFQVLTNLLDNALKFTQRGRVDLTVRVTGAGGDDTAAEVVEFVVQDTGIGIPAAALDSMFDSFTQVDGSTTRLYGGSGLGLAITKELTQLMGGSISVSSRCDVGSTFTVRVPLDGADVVDASPRQAALDPQPRSTSWTHQRPVSVQSPS